MVGTAAALPVILPTLFTAFFYGATYGCLCNKEGGLRGVVIGSFIGGLVNTFMPALLISWGGVLVSETTFGGSDSAVAGIAYRFLSMAISGPGILIITLILSLLPAVYSAVTRNKPGLTEAAEEAE